MNSPSVLFFGVNPHVMFVVQARGPNTVLIRARKSNVFFLGGVVLRISNYVATFLKQLPAMFFMSRY